MRLRDLLIFTTVNAKESRGRLTGVPVWGDPGQWKVGGLDGAVTEPCLDVAESKSSRTSETKHAIGHSPQEAETRLHEARHERINQGLTMARHGRLV